jgi:hypothetical protein
MNVANLQIIGNIVQVIKIHLQVKKKHLKKSWKQSIDHPKKLILSKKFWKLALNKLKKIDSNMKKLDKWILKKLTKKNYKQLQLEE